MSHFAEGEQGVASEIQVLKVDDKLYQADQLFAIIGNTPVFPILPEIRANLAEKVCNCRLIVKEKMALILHVRRYGYDRK